MNTKTAALAQITRDVKISRELASEMQTHLTREGSWPEAQTLLLGLLIDQVGELAKIIALLVEQER